MDYEPETRTHHREGMVMQGKDGYPGQLACMLCSYILCTTSRGHSCQRRILPHQSGNSKTPPLMAIVQSYSTHTRTILTKFNGASCRYMQGYQPEKVKESAAYPKARGGGSRGDSVPATNRTRMEGMG